MVEGEDCLFCDFLPKRTSSRRREKWGSCVARPNIICKGEREREGGREGGREGERKGGREGGRKRGREGGGERGREEEREGIVYRMRQCYWEAVFALAK